MSGGQGYQDTRDTRETRETRATRESWDMRNTGKIKGNQGHHEVRICQGVKED